MMAHDEVDKQLVCAHTSCMYIVHGLPITRTKCGCELSVIHVYMHQVLYAEPRTPPPPTSLMVGWSQGATRLQVGLL